VRALLSDPASVQRDVESDGVEETSLRAHDVQPPAAPLVGGAALLAQLPDRPGGLGLGRFEISDFDACFIQDCFATVHEVEEAAHFETCVTGKSGHNVLSGSAEYRKRTSGRLDQLYPVWRFLGLTSARSSRDTQPKSGFGQGTR